ncbi:MAG: STAS domain-containing protein [Ginsengibacter sp.]
MKVKIDTKEKMHVITIEEEELTANMTEQLIQQANSFLDTPIQNVILIFSKVKKISLESLNSLLSMQQSFYNAEHSMVFCEFQKNIENMVHEHHLEDIMNVTPSESEAWDMVQMEEIERELF